MEADAVGFEGWKRKLYTELCPDICIGVLLSLHISMYMYWEKLPMGNQKLGKEQLPESSKFNIAQIPDLGDV